MDDGEPQTCVRSGQLLTTWRTNSGQWLVHIESVLRQPEPAIQAEKVLPPGNDRLDAYEFGKALIDRVVRRTL